jgi:3-methylcrotonyl-CoA carboxylase beta subunit
VQSVIVAQNGTVFLGGPPLVRAATGEIVSSEELGGAAVHCKTSGVTDHFATSDPHALQIARSIVSNLHLAGRTSSGLVAPPAPFPVEAPLYNEEELRGVVPSDSRKPFDIRSVLARVLDGSKLDEFKALYGSTLITGTTTVESDRNS